MFDAISGTFRSLLLFIIPLVLLGCSVAEAPISEATPDELPAQSRELLTAAVNDEKVEQQPHLTGENDPILLTSIIALPGYQAAFSGRMVMSGPCVSLNLYGDVRSIAVDGGSGIRLATEPDFLVTAGETSFAEGEMISVGGGHFVDDISDRLAMNFFGRTIPEGCSRSLVVVTSIEKSGAGK